MTYETGRATSVDPSNVETRDDFAHFLLAVLADFRSTGEAEWDNSTLDHFLDRLSAFANTRVVEAPEFDQERASWRLFAEIVGPQPGTSSTRTSAATGAREPLGPPSQPVLAAKVTRRAIMPRSVRLVSGGWTLCR